MTVAIEGALLDELFPANIHLDRKLRITAFSPSIARNYPDIQSGSDLFHHFDLPGGNDPDYITLPHKRLKTIQLGSKCGGYRLTGSIAPHEHGYFLALRHVPTEKSCKENRFRMSDFAPGDPTVQGIMLINLQRAMIEESQDTALELGFERQRCLDLLARIGRVTNYMAHDFNNFLSIVQLNCDRLAREYRGNKRAERILAIIHDTVVRGASLTGPLMQMTEPQADTPTPVAIDALIEDNKALLQAVVGPHIALKIEPDIGAGEAMLSHIQMLDCLIHLLINARDAMPDGGEITIATAIRPGKPGDSEADPAGPVRDYLAIEIAATGKGLSSAVLSHAIEPLLLPKSHGSIFGLTSALDFTRKMGGDACLDLAPDEGPRLCLYFPVASAAEREAAGRSDDGPYDLPGVKGRILLLEHEPFAQEALVELLEAEGYAVTACETAEQALLANGNAAHDVLLTDIALPCQSGAEFAVSACDLRPALKVVLMCGYMPDKAGLQPGWTCIRKPLDSGELLEQLSAAVAKPETRASFCAR